MSLEAAGMLKKAAKFQYLCNLVHVQLLLQFDLLPYYVEIANPLTVDSIISGLGLYFFSAKFLSKQKRVMRRKMKKPSELKVRLYTSLLIILNK